MRLIDADALMDDIKNTIEESGCVNHESEIMDCIRYASEVDPVPVMRGEWEQDGEYPWLLNCSVCSDSIERGTNYCPNCGAKMEDKP